MSRFGLFALSALMLASLLVTGPAAAVGKPKVALEVDFALPVNMNGAKPGAGGALRGGYDLDLTIVHVMPEIGIGVHKLTEPGGPSIIRGFAGGRAGIGAGVRFDAFLHIGYGSVAYPAAGLDSSYGTPILDGGLALDFTLLPVVDLGLHVSYNTAFKTLGTSDTPRWLGLGAHLAVAF